MTDVRSTEDRITAVLRTVVPAAWGTLLAWLVGRGLVPAETATGAAPLGAQLVDLVVAPLAIGGYYAAARWLESRTWVPRWIVRLLLGSARRPVYRVPIARGW